MIVAIPHDCECDEDAFSNCRTLKKAVLINGDEEEETGLLTLMMKILLRLLMRMLNTIVIYFGGISMVHIVFVTC